eukprot:6481823-Amphidinium_carterae.1
MLFDIRPSGGCVRNPWVSVPPGLVVDCPRRGLGSLALVSFVPSGALFAFQRCPPLPGARCDGRPSGGAC